MRGTWQTTGDSGPGLEWAATALVAAALVFGGVSWLAARAWWILGGVAVLLAVAVVGGWFAWRATRRMRAGELAQIAAFRAVRAEAAPQVSRGTAAPAIEQHVHYHYHGRDVPAVIRGEVER